MKKYITLWIIATSLILLVSCTLPWQSGNQNQRWNYSGMRWWKMRWWEDISDIVRLKDRKWWPRWEMMWSWRIERFGSGSSWARMWSWIFMDRFSSLSQADKDLLRQSMEARRSWDKEKSEKIMNTLKTKYPDVFSGSMMPGELRKSSDWQNNNILPPQ